MNIYHIWCNLKPGVSDVEFTLATDQFLTAFKQEGKLAGYRITRRKLGLGADNLGEFHLMLEFNDLAQLDAAFDLTASREDPVEAFHHAVNSKVTDVKFALYRDFPDPNRTQGQEKF